MRLLLSNDDGYDAPGITVLAQALSEKHEVYICAPLTQMSATSHAINISKALEIKRINEKTIAIAGTPADCVKSALSGLFPEIRFDAVISGINDGPNMAEDVFYSGTVAAAREGALNGIFSIACSRDGWELGKNYENPARFILEFLDTYPSDRFQLNSIININFPQTGVWNDVELCTLGSRIYLDSTRIYFNGEKEFLQIEGEAPSFQDQPGSDLNAVHYGNISITALANVEHDQNLHNSLEKVVNSLNK